MDSNGLISVVNGKGIVVGLCYHLFIDSPGGHGIGVAVEADRKIRINPAYGGITAIWEEIR